MAGGNEHGNDDDDDDANGGNDDDGMILIKTKMVQVRMITEMTIKILMVMMTGQWDDVCWDDMTLVMMMIMMEVV